MGVHSTMRTGRPAPGLAVLVATITLVGVLSGCSSTSTGTSQPGASPVSAGSGASADVAGSATRTGGPHGTDDTVAGASSAAPSSSRTTSPTAATSHHPATPTSAAIPPDSDEPVPTASAPSPSASSRSTRSPTGTSRHAATTSQRPHRSARPAKKTAIQNFRTPGLHIKLTLPTDLGRRHADVHAASTALVGELQTLTKAWLDPRQDWSGPLRKYTTGSAANDDIASVAFYRKQREHMVGHLSVAITLDRVAKDAVHFDSCFNDLLQDFADSDGNRAGYFPADGFHHHVVKATVVRSPGSATGWLVSKTDYQKGTISDARTCISY